MFAKRMTNGKYRRKPVWWTVVGVGLTWVAIIAAVLFLCSGCERKETTPSAISDIKQAKAEVHVGADGLTNEQRNVKDRYKMDSLPGAIKHLYVQSAYTGDVLLYSTVRGKVTSSGKRLSPTTVYAGALESGNNPVRLFGIPTSIGGIEQHTTEVLQDDGTYGSSTEYLYWWDAQGRYHQHYPNGGQIIHVTNEPLPVKKAFLRFEEPAEAPKGTPAAHK